MIVYQGSSMIKSAIEVFDKICTGIYHYQVLVNEGRIVCIIDPTPWLDTQPILKAILEVRETYKEDFKIFVEEFYRGLIYVDFQSINERETVVTDKTFIPFTPGTDWTGFTNEVTRNFTTNKLEKFQLNSALSLMLTRACTLQNKWNNIPFLFTLDNEFLYFFVTNWE